MSLEQAWKTTICTPRQPVKTAGTICWHASYFPSKKYIRITITITGFLLVNLGNCGLGGLLGTFGYGTEDYEESGPETEIPGRDLDFGRGLAGRSLGIGLEKCVKV